MGEETQGRGGAELVGDRQAGRTGRRGERERGGGAE